MGSAASPSENIFITKSNILLVVRFLKIPEKKGLKNDQSFSN
jgi:hypothetical protein